MNTPLQNSTPASPPMGEALQQLLANPDLLRRVREILAPTAETPADAPSEDSPVSAAPSTPPPATDGLASLLGDPALLEKLPQIMATVKPLLATLPTTPPAQAAEPKSLPACRDHLLLSLKPFLSPTRRDAVDTILRIARLGEILGQLKS
ncbi:MAG: hypothetical protein IJX28_02465 [Clostridia bacterium]|nr:hypothetical protein [Clostridia bacterium]